MREFLFFHIFFCSSVEFLWMEVIFEPFNGFGFVIRYNKEKTHVIAHELRSTNKFLFHVLWMTSFALQVQIRFDCMQILCGSSTPIFFCCERKYFVLFMLSFSRFTGFLVAYANIKSKLWKKRWWPGIGESILFDLFSRTFSCINSIFINTCSNFNVKLLEEIQYIGNLLTFTFNWIACYRYGFIYLYFFLHSEEIDGIFPDRLSKPI